MLWPVPSAVFSFPYSSRFTPYGLRITPLPHAFFALWSLSFLYPLRLTPHALRFTLWAMLHAPCPLRFLICFTPHSLRLTPYALLFRNYSMPYALCSLLFKVDTTLPVVYSVHQRRQERELVLIKWVWGLRRDFKNFD